MSIDVSYGWCSRDEFQKKLIDEPIRELVRNYLNSLSAYRALINKEKTMTTATATVDFVVTDTKDDRETAKKIMQGFTKSIEGRLKELSEFTTGSEVAGFLKASGWSGDTSDTGNPVAKFLTAYCDIYDAKLGKYVEPKISVKSYTSTIEHDGIKATFTTPGAVRGMLSDLTWGSFGYLLKK